MIRSSDILIFSKFSKFFSLLKGFVVYLSFLNCCLQKCNTKIQVHHDCCPRSTDRVVQINGRPVDIVNCIAAIVELVIVVCFMSWPLVFVFGLVDFEFIYLLDVEKV